MRNVIILGSGRSGTSLLAGTLATAGYDFGGTPYPARAANPKGFFETHAVNGVNEEILAAALPRHPRFEAGQRWLAQCAVETEFSSTKEIDERIQRLTARTPFCFKDPRFCYTLPVWRPYLGDALNLCVFRDPAVTARSIVKECRTESYLRSLRMTSERALAAWTAMYTQVLERHRHTGDWRFVHYDQLLQRDGLERLAQWTGADIDFEFPESRLDRTRDGSPVPAATEQVYLELCALADQAPNRKVTVAVGALPAAKRHETATANTEAPRLSVILCTYNRRTILERSLKSFFAQDCAPGTFEIIVVNDGSTDGTRAYLEGLELPIPGRILQRENGGLAAARNTGIAAARGEFLLFVNDDTIAFQNLVSEHLAIHAAAEKNIAVLGTFEQPIAALDNALMRYLEVSDFVFRYRDMKNGERYDYQRFWTCNVSVRADLVRSVGAFDERFRVYGSEDIDLGFRLHQRGVEVQYCATARALHDHVLDFDALKKRQRVCASSFVHLFHKEPRTLLHPDWNWARGRSVADLEQGVDEKRSRLPALEVAVRELASLDLGALDAPEAGSSAVVSGVLNALDVAMQELNAVWWQQGFADGLRQFGYDGFPALAARVELPGRSLVPLDDADLEARITDVRAIAASGETVLATIEAIRLYATATDVTGSSESAARAHLRAEILNDLGALRFAAEDAQGAKALFEAALGIDSEHACARANLADIASAGRARPRWCEGPDAQALPTSLNSWVKDALRFAEEHIGFAGHDVLEVGGAIPPEIALLMRPKRWVAGYPGAAALDLGPYRREDLDARKLDLPDESFDLIFSSCAFEHVNDFERALAEMRRVLRPGGAVVTHFAPIWSCAVGHHLWETDQLGTRIMFNDRVVPDFAHLLLDERELELYLTIVLGRESAKRCVEFILRHTCINRVFEGQFQRWFSAAGFDTSQLERLPPWAATHVATPRLKAELLRVHPEGGDFDTPGLRGVLRLVEVETHESRVNTDLAGVA